MSTIGFLKFNPIFKYRIWGGEKLKNVLQKPYEETKIGESWELSGVKNDESIVANGFHKGQSLSALLEKFTYELVGRRCYEQFGAEFPILIKFIDANIPLSVQVHPSDALAKERHQSFGKNEMWYIMDAEEDAELILGFKKELDKEQFQSHIDQGDLMSVMNTEKVQPGDVCYIPTGRVHAIGQGVLLAEIQQTSDVTYRVYDFDRVDQKTGQKRELHVAQALDAIDFTPVDEYKTAYNTNSNTVNPIIETPYFTTDFLEVTEKVVRNYEALDSFRIFICTSGRGKLVLLGEESIYLQKGETLLIPANETQVTITPGAGEKLQLLEVSI